MPRGLAFMVLAAALPVLACACSKKPGTVIQTTLTVRLAADPACQPTNIAQLRVSALGDFATSDLSVGLWNPSTGSLSFETFPLHTAAIRIENERAWAGTRYLDGSEAHEILLLPMGTPCSLSDDAFAGSEGASVVALPDGSMLAIGGYIDSSAQRSVVRLRAGTPRPERLDVNDALFTRRAFASATVTGEHVVVVGGETTRAGSEREDSVEIYDLVTGRFEREATAPIFLQQGRSHHGAVRLPDGRVLVAGGVGAMGLLNTAEILDLADGSVSAPIQLPRSRRDPFLTVLDDGTVLLIGGSPNIDGTAALSDVLVLDEAGGEFLELSEDLFLDGRGGAAVVALPGNRVAYIGGNDPTGEFVDVVDVIHADGAAHVERPALRNARCTDGVFCESMHGLHATRLLDGRVYVTGTNESGVAHAVLLDFSRNIATAVTAHRGVQAAITLADGSTVLMSADGVVMRRDTVLMTFDNPSTLIAGSLDGLALDAPAHWDITPSALTARSEARVDVPALRFRDVRVELDATGDVDVLLLGEGDLEAVTVRENEIGFALCSAPRVPGSTAVIVRHDNTLTFSSGGAEVICEASGGLGDRIGVALTARHGTELRALRLLRTGTLQDR